MKESIFKTGPGAARHRDMPRSFSGTRRENDQKRIAGALFQDVVLGRLLSTQEEAVAQLDQYFQSPEEYDTDPEGVLQVLHKVELKSEDSEYLQARTVNIIDKIPEIDAKLNEVAAGWKTKRMGKVELTILRLALFEMLYDENIPEKVSINEAVEPGQEVWRQ